MSNTISPAEYQRRLQTVLNLAKLQEIVAEELIKDESTLKMLKEQDFLEGDIFGDGRSYATYRSVGYSKMKQAKNPLAGGKVDLILTGKFVDSMFLKKAKSGSYTFGNTDTKRNILKEIYGDNIFGLNQKVFDKYLNDITAPRLYRKIKTIAKIG